MFTRVLQFSDIVETCEYLASVLCKVVIVAALDGTFKREPFGTILNLIPLVQFFFIHWRERDKLLLYIICTTIHHISRLNVSPNSLLCVCCACVIWHHLQNAHLMKLKQMLLEEVKSMLHYVVHATSDVTPTIPIENTHG